LKKRYHKQTQYFIIRILRILKPIKKVSIRMARNEKGLQSPEAETPTDFYFF